jgi:hypothetical protein
MEIHKEHLSEFLENVKASPMIIFTDTQPLKAAYISELTQLLGLKNSLDTKRP